MKAEILPRILRMFYQLTRRHIPEAVSQHVTEFCQIFLWNENIYVRIAKEFKLAKTTCNFELRGKAKIFDAHKISFGY